MLRKWVSTEERYPTTDTPVLCRWILEQDPEIHDVAYRKANGVWLDMEGHYLRPPDYWMETMGLREMQCAWWCAKERICKNCAFWGFGAPLENSGNTCRKLHMHGLLLDISGGMTYGVTTPPTFGCNCFEKRAPQEPKDKRHFRVDDDGRIQYGLNWFDPGNLSKKKQRRVTLARLCAWLNDALGKRP